MTTQKIDVLAVIGRLTDLALNSGGRRGEDETDNEPAIKLYEDATKARAAVAELIEALRETTAAIGYLNRAYPSGELAGAWQRNDAFDRAKAALARIGGAA